VIEKVLSSVSDAFDISRDMLVSHDRREFILPARFAAYHIAHRVCRMKYMHIGAAMGGRDHKTIAYGCSRAEYMLERDPSYAAVYEEAVNGL
jgi:chromosomal replication initiator protein